ncbi:uncharacterized membrane protein YcaP (DUF421 family) [Geomicrobium halophilum]|uniref:Uncharacterized membrane protein YcaP (DUF421 family) n=1 Tax=Geomicrobium halophilum TaxID=549000 RepID=A0A841PVP6_9BACL|nr:DUF421 domain-containing protein [Geomicrobium halophilum]MBB6448283.1 uncharacterized membrane protein YcaP (DUF421 family) [Geomicrobium halophilum]
MLSNLRSKGYSSVQGIQYAILEPFGDLSILPKEEIQPVTPRDLHLDVEEAGIPIVVIVEGIIQHENLKLLHRDESWLRYELQKQGYTKPEEVFLATVRDKNHQMMVDDGVINNL